ncbi:MAG: DUF3052 domain-containing protein [Chloroflexi bacterium]|nr:DUF3052 domain-containing protein [Chloroflexota bacterium]
MRSRVPEPAGYSGTPLAKKLGIKPGNRVGLVGAPESFESTTLHAPAEAKVLRLDASSPPMRGRGLERGAKLEAGEFDVVVYFTTRQSELRARFEEMARAISPNGGLWIAWPKRASGVPTDLTENLLREVGLPFGLVDNKVCAIDATWSGLRFVWRLERRGALSP